jgi:hypothetical protein
VIELQEGLVLAGVLAIRIGFIMDVRRRRRVPGGLCGEWWPDFERQFRAYALKLDRRDD